MQHLYFCACAETGGIYHYTMAPDGGLRFCEKLPLDRPMYMVLQGRKAYVLLREIDPVRRHGGLAVCDIAADGNLCPPKTVEDTGGIVPCHLCVWDGAVYVVNYLSGNLVKLPGGKTVLHSGQGPHPTRQAAAHTHFVVPAPGGNLLCTDLGLDTVFTYDRDLNELGRAQVPPGSGPRHLAVSADGQWVYCVNELGNSVSVFAFAGGRLRLQNTCAALPGYRGQSTAAAIRLRGEYLYISNRGADTLTRFLCRGNALQLLENIPCGGQAPRDFDIVGQHIFCTNEGSGTVTVLRLENGRPVLTETVLHMEAPLCVCAAAW